MDHRPLGKCQLDTRPGSPLGSGLRLRLKADVVVDGIPQSLFAAQIPFSRLDADVPEQELNLFEFSTGLVTQARACAAKVVWRNVRQSATGRSLFDNTPNHLGLKPCGAIRPALLMARKTAPSVTPASLNQTATASATQSGIGTVLM